MNVKTNAIAQKTANIQKAPYDPMASWSEAKNFVTKNPSTQQVPVTIELAADLILGGNISPEGWK